MTPIAQTEIPLYFPKIFHVQSWHTKPHNPPQEFLPNNLQTELQASERTCKAHSKLHVATREHQLRTNAAQSKLQTHGLKNGAEKPSQTRFPPKRTSIVRPYLAMHGGWRRLKKKERATSTWFQSNRKHTLLLDSQLPAPNYWWPSSHRFSWFGWDATCSLFHREHPVLRVSGGHCTAQGSFLLDALWYMRWGLWCCALTSFSKCCSYCVNLWSS